MLGRAGRVRVMLADAQIGLVHMMHQAVEDVWRLAHRRRDHLRMERAVAPGDVRIEPKPWVDAVFGVDRAAGPGAPAGPEILTV